MQLVSPIPSNWENVQQNTISIRLRQHNIVLFETQEVQKVTSKELHRILMTTIKHKPTSQKH